MARALTAAQQAALEAYDRKTLVIVEIEDADGSYEHVVDLTDKSLFHSATLQFSADAPISRGTFAFWKKSAGESLAPLMEGSELNRDGDGNYAPRINPARGIRVKVAPMLPGQTPGEGDWLLLWDGVVDDLDSAGELVRVHARDRLALLNDTFIEDVTRYGGGSPPEPIEDVMQAILDDKFGSGAWPLTVIGDPDFGITGKDGDGYDLGNVTVLEALTELRDLIGWNLHYRWNEAAGEFRLTFYEPDREDTTPSWTFGPDQYYRVGRLAIGVEGIRNAGKVLYTDADGEEQEASDERSTSIALYGRRFILLDERGSSVQTSAQATRLLDGVLDDLESPPALQEIDAAFHWPLELGDVNTYEANGEHYDTDQTWAVFGYQHVITPGQIRTVIEAAGKPSGGFRRWHRKEARSQRERTHPRVISTSYGWNTLGELVVTVQTEGARSVRVAAGASRPTDADIGDASLETVDGDGVAEINLGTGYSGQVVTGTIAYERADGSGFVSDTSVSSRFMVEYIEAEAGTIGGWDIDDDEISTTGFSLNSSTRRLLIGAATAVLTGVGIFAGHVGDGTYDLRVGDPAGSYLHWDESEAELEVAGRITATSGAIGGWEIGEDEIASPDGGITLDAAAERILVGAATAPLVGEGVFIGLSGGAYQARFGDPSGDYLLYDGSALVLAGEIVQNSNLVDLAVTGDKVDHDTLTAIHIASLNFTTKTLVADTGSVGGWLMSAGTLHSSEDGARITIDAANERITIGSASDPTTGVGVFIGSDGAGGWDLRAGDPSGHYIHWDESEAELILRGTLDAVDGTFSGTLDGADGTFSGTLSADAIVAAESFTAPNPVFSGSLRVDAGAGGQRFRVDADSGRGRVRIYNASDAQVGEWRSDVGNQTSLVSVGTLALRSGGLVAVTDGANFDVGGVISGDELVLDQGGGDGAIVQLRSTDVLHPFASHANTQTYGILGKSSATAGGVKLEGYSESRIGVEIIGMQNTAWTTKNNAAEAAIVIGGWGRPLGGVARDLEANANILAVRSGGNTRFIVDHEGDYHYDGTGSAFDAYDDAEMVRALALATADPGQVIRSEFDDLVRYNEADLVEAGILGAPRSEGGLINGAQLQRLHTGAIWQQATRTRRLEGALLSLLDQNPEIRGREGAMAALRGGDDA